MFVSLSKYLDYKLMTFDQNRVVRNIQNFKHFFFQKWLTSFDKVLTPFWKAFESLKQFFDAEIFNILASKNCIKLKFKLIHLLLFQKIRPPHATSLKNVPNMADSISPNEN